MGALLVAWSSMIATTAAANNTPEHRTNAALVFGGRGGKGLISVRGKDGAWSNPNYINVGGGSWGLQAGVQKSDLILVFTSPRGVDNIIKGKFTHGNDAAVTAGPVGRNLQASTDEKLKAATYS